MKRELKRRREETLHEWHKRLAPSIRRMNEDEIEEVLHEVSFTAYVEGTRVMEDTLRLKNNRHYGQR